MNVTLMTNLDLSGAKVLIREDLNVPIHDGQVSSDARIRAAVPTIRKALDQAAQVILMSHLGRPSEGEFTHIASLQPVADHLSVLLGEPVTLIRNWQNGLEDNNNKLVMLENVRFNEGEKANDDTLAQSYAALCDIFVMDAFGTAHRAHASTTIVAQFFEDKCAGYIMGNELNNAKKVLEDPKRPFTAIMGGAKISDKIMIIEKLLNKVDHLIIGGGMSYTFSKAQGGAIGKSLCEDNRMALTLELIEKAKAKGVKLYLPLDNVIADDFSNNAHRQIVNSGEISDDWEGLDIGPQSINAFENVIKNSKTIY